MPDPIFQPLASSQPDREDFTFAGAETPAGSGALARDEDDFALALALLARMNHDFGLSTDIATMLDRALASVAAQLDAEAGSLWLVEGDGREVACQACVGPHPNTGLRLPISEGIVGRCVREDACQSVLDVDRDPHFSRIKTAQSGFVMRSILCAPLSHANRALGAIELINRRSGDGLFRASEARRLRALAAAAALAIASARTAETLVERERVRRELELAAGIQRALLPVPRPEPFPVCGVNVAARTLSGDFYDIVPLADSRIAFCVGDVSGEGVHAVLLLAKAASLFRCLAKSIASPAALLAALDLEIAAATTRGSRVKLAAGVFDPVRGEILLANAGIEPALLHASDGAFRSLPASAAPLGGGGGGAFPESRVELNGGTLYLFSDGLIAATCAANPDRLANAALAQLIERFASKPPAARIAAIASDAGRSELSDDLTLLAVSDARRRSG